MEGVNILNIIENSNSVSAGIVLLVFGGLIALGLILSIMAAIILNEASDLIPLSPVCGLLAFIMIVGGIDILCNSKTKYEVTIDNNVNFTEFTNRYEVVEQRGEIYVITERK